MSGVEGKRKRRGQVLSRTFSIFLSGSVMYADGSPADMTAKVELWCDGLVRRQVPTLDGVFSLQVGGSTVAPATFDAEGGRSLEMFSGPRYVHSRGNVIPLVDLTGCELRAQQEGFQSDEINLSFRRPVDNSDVGALVLYQAGSIVGTIDSVTTMKAPRQARKRLRRALKELRHFLELRPEAPEGARVKGFLSDWGKKGLIQGSEKN